MLSGTIQERRPSVTNEETTIVPGEIEWLFIDSYFSREMNDCFSLMNLP